MRKGETEEKARLEREGQELLTSDVQFKALSKASTFKGEKKQNKKEKEKRNYKNAIWAEF